MFSGVKKCECDHSALWGWINDVPYHNRGWCAAEFSCALKASIIANLHDPDVQVVCMGRNWPHNVADFKTMMDDASMDFTSQGDRNYVSYLFFMVSFDLRGAVA